MMKAFRFLGRSFRDASKSVFRNFSLSLASISCIAITLVLLSFSMILSFNVDNFAKLIQKDVTIVVFVNKDAKGEKIATIENNIANLENIASYDFRSKEEEALNLRKSSDTFEVIINNWEVEGENPLRDSFTVKVEDIEKIGTTAKELRAIENVEIVRYGENVVNKLISAFEIVGNITLVVVIALVVVTAFLITNTIKITIFSRKREISIMRLVGASNSSIKLPFIIEGLFLGILGAVIPIVVTIYGYFYLYTNFDGQMISPLIQLVKPEPFIYYVSILLIIISMIVGMVGSSSAVRRYLKV